VSPRAVRWLLWLAALFVVPLPTVAFGPGLVPAAHQLELGLLALAFGAVESTEGVTLLMASLFLVSGLVYAALLWLLAWLAARVLTPLAPTTRTRLALLLVMLGVALAVAEPVYRTPFSSRSASSNLLGVYW
jgi:glucan phosphoethanolaminetransferase (alkaline phosphatase superfamily)